MELLNILYSNNLIAVYLIGAILVVILIFIIISSIDTKPKEKKAILNDPIEEENKTILKLKEEKEEVKDVPKINDIVEDLYQRSLETITEEKKEPKDLNSFLEEFEVPKSVIEEVVSNNDTEEYNDEPIKTENQLINNPEIIIPETKEIETPRLKTNDNTENIEDMLKRLYDLRQNENEARKSALLNEIYDLKKQVDENLKSNANNFTLDYNHVDTNALVDYYLFNEDIEFPKLK